MSTEPGRMAAPRLQLRWGAATEDEADGHTPASLRAAFKSTVWTCHYELVLPLREGDIRRGYPDEPDYDVLVIPLGKTTTTSLQREPSHPPYRDGHHAQRDSTLLGKLPVYHVASDGSFRIQDEPE
jgi:hypothetical protein